MKMRVLALMALAATIGLGAANPGFVDAKEGKAPRVEQQLTAEQQATYKKIIDESRMATADIRKELDAKRAELKTVLQSENPDKARIEALSTEIGTLRGKLLSAKVDVNAQLKKEGLPTRRLDNPGKQGGKKDGKGPRRPRGERPDQESGN